ncbi:MAG: DUF3857 and transglutaminase domain-containing protein [Bacteroidota bacterium]
MIKKIFLSVTLVIVSIVLHGDPIQDLIKKAGNTGDYPDAELLIIFDSTRVDVQETGLSYFNEHKLYKVLTPEGAKKLNIIKYDYDPLSAFVEIRKVRIYRETGDIEDLDTKKVLDYPAPARGIYWGGRQKMMEIGRLEPGDAVEVYMFKKGFTYALLQEDEDERYIPPMRGHFYDIVEFWNDNPIQIKVYSVKIPGTKFVQYHFYNGDVDSTILKVDDKVQYTFTKRDISPIEKEPHMVAFSDVAPKLLISTSPDWETKSKWFYNVNEDYGSFESTPEIDAKVAEILKGAKDEADTIYRLTHWTADEIRYSGISMGKGEGFTLHKGQMDLTDRCGVCKDKAGMLITLLRAAGFDSYPAMTMAGSRIDKIPADQFNHCVTIVRLSDGKYHLLDPTWVPFVRELWSSAEQQQNYLMGVPEGADLMITPLSPPENHYFRITGSSELHPDGTLEGEFTVTAEGQTDAYIRRGFVRNDKSEWNTMVEKEMLKVAPMIQIKEMNYGDPYDYSDPIEIRIKYKIPEYALVTAEEILFIPFVASNLFEKYNIHLSFKTDLEKREYPYRDRCSRLVELNETIKLPDSLEVIYIPDSISSEGSGADFEGGYSIDGQTLTLFEKATHKKRVYQPEDWESYKEAVTSQNKFAEEYIILKIVDKQNLQN